MGIGFIGLGRMGQRMAQRLIDAELEVSLYDAKPAKASAISGAAIEVISAGPVG